MAIVYTQDNGVAAICNRISSVPEGKLYDEVENDSFPLSRVFRDAWVVDTGAIVEDLPKTKVIATGLADARRQAELEPNIRIVQQYTQGDAMAAQTAIDATHLKWDGVTAGIDSAMFVPDIVLILDAA